MLSAVLLYIIMDYILIKFMQFLIKLAVRLDALTVNFYNTWVQTPARLWLISLNWKALFFNFFNESLCVYLFNYFPI